MNFCFRILSESFLVENTIVPMKAFLSEKALPSIVACRTGTNNLNVVDICFHDYRFFMLLSIDKKLSTLA